MKPGDHRTLHCRCVFNFLSHSLQPAPIPAEVSGNASDLAEDHPRKLQRSFSISQVGPCCLAGLSEPEPNLRAPGESSSSSCGFSQRGGLRVTKPTKPNCYKDLNSSIPRKLQGSLANPKALAHLPTPRLSSQEGPVSSALPRLNHL